MEEAGPLVRVEHGRYDEDEGKDEQVYGGGGQERGEITPLQITTVCREGVSKVPDVIYDVGDKARHDHTHQEAEEEGARLGNVQLQLWVAVQAEDGVGHAEEEQGDHDLDRIHLEGGREPCRDDQDHRCRRDGGGEHHDGLEHDEEDGDPVVALDDLGGVRDEEGEVGHGGGDPPPALLEELVHGLRAVGVVL